MFQTEWIIAMQASADSGISQFWQFITDLGYGLYYAVFLVFITFGINLRKGFLLVQVLVCTLSLTIWAKNYFALPRPFHVDKRVTLLDKQMPDRRQVQLLDQAEGLGFWETLPDSAVQYFREREKTNYGFPSGHTSMSVAFWGTLPFLFNLLSLRVLSLVLLILIPFSRMYLGVHFLADVVAGFVLGAGVWWFFYQVYFKNYHRELYLFQGKSLSKGSNQRLFLSLPLFFFLLLPSKYYEFLIFYLGFNFFFLFMDRVWGCLLMRAEWHRRAINAGIGLGLSFGLFYVRSQLLGGLPEEGYLIVRLVADFVTIGLVTYLSVLIGKKLHNYHPFP